MTYGTKTAAQLYADKAAGVRFTEETLAARLDELLKAHQKAAKPATRSATVIDEDWIADLEDNDLYAAVDVRRELGKAQMWASTNNRQMTRRRFVNWLNRALQDAPIGVNGAGQSSRARAARDESEPHGWREWVRENCMSPEWADRAWGDLENIHRDYITKQLKGI